MKPRLKFDRINRLWICGTDYFDACAADTPRGAFALWKLMRGREFMGQA